jgi:hypothetical protein
MDAKRHFCRDRDQPHEEGFERNKAYLEAERDRVIELLMDYDPEIRKARRIMGWCLHTVQDAFSHSNYAQMTDADRQTFIEAVTDVCVEPPPGFLLVCPGPDSRDSLSYGHDDHHKDHESSPEGEEAFREAKDGAVIATREFVETTRKMFFQAMGDEAVARDYWNRLMEMDRSGEEETETSKAQFRD